MLTPQCLLKHLPLAYIPLGSLPPLPPHLLVFHLPFLHHLLLRRQFGSVVAVLRTHQALSSATLGSEPGEGFCTTEFEHIHQTGLLRHREKHIEMSDGRREGRRVSDGQPLETAPTGTQGAGRLEFQTKWLGVWCCCGGEEGKRRRVSESGGKGPIVRLLS